MFLAGDEVLPAWGLLDDRCARRRCIGVGIGRTADSRAYRSADDGTDWPADQCSTDYTGSNTSRGSTLGHS